MTRSLASLTLLLAVASLTDAFFAPHPTSHRTFVLNSDRIFTEEEMTSVAADAEGDPYADMTKEDLDEKLKTLMPKALKPGDALPDVTLSMGQSGYEPPVEVSLRALCEGKYVGIVFEPRAFSPDCMEMVNYYVEMWEALQDPDQNKVEPLDEFVFVCPDDAFVMHVSARGVDGRERANAGRVVFCAGLTSFRVRAGAGTVVRRGDGGPQVPVGFQGRADEGLRRRAGEGRHPRHARSVSVHDQGRQGAVHRCGHQEAHANDGLGYGLPGLEDGAIRLAGKGRVAGGGNGGRIDENGDSKQGDLSPVLYFGCFSTITI